MCEHHGSKYRLLGKDILRLRLGSETRRGWGGPKAHTQLQHPSFSLGATSWRAQELSAAKKAKRSWQISLSFSAESLVAKWAQQAVTGRGKQVCILREEIHMGRRPLLSTGAMGSQSRNYSDLGCFAPVPGGSEKPRREPGAQTADSSGLSLPLESTETCTCTYMEHAGGLVARTPRAVISEPVPSVALNHNRQDLILPLQSAT